MKILTGISGVLAAWGFFLGSALALDANDISMLVRNGVSDQVVVNLVLNNKLPMPLTTEEILFLNASGISPALLEFLTRPEASYPPGEYAMDDSTPLVSQALCDNGTICSDTALFDGECLTGDCGLDVYGQPSAYVYGEQGYYGTELHESSTVIVDSPTYYVESPSYVYYDSSPGYYGGYYGSPGRYDYRDRPKNRPSSTRPSRPSAGKPGRPESRPGNPPRKPSSGLGAGSSSGGRPASPGARPGKGNGGRGRPEQVGRPANPGTGSAKPGNGHGTIERPKRSSGDRSSGSGARIERKKSSADARPRQAQEKKQDAQPPKRERRR